MGEADAYTNVMAGGAVPPSDRMQITPADCFESAP